MIKHHPSQPIGIFDSGIGGLTVAHALLKLLPRENMIYFGDTAHLPYGDKSATTIQSYSIKIVNVLLQQQCKLILIACNSASAAAFDLVKEYVGEKAHVMNVIDPTIHLLRNQYANKKLGLIGTRQTVNSNIYKTKIDFHQCGIQLNSIATNLLASAIEEFGNNQAIDGLITEYLSHPNLKNIDALLLACTHYPVIKDKIAKHFNHQIEVIDSSHVVAESVETELREKNLLNQNGNSNKHFYLSDFTESFIAAARIFFPEEIKLEHYPLE